MRRRKTKAGHRSKFEDRFAAALGECGVEYGYEVTCLPFTQPAKQRRYTPDYTLTCTPPIIIETKGRLTAADRAKMLLVKAQHPELDIRLVFQNASVRLSKVSRTTYGEWAERNGFLWANERIPEEWLKEYKARKQGNELASSED